jgi:hypothetical protein
MFAIVFHVFQTYVYVSNVSAVSYMYVAIV